MSDWYSDDEDNTDIPANTEAEESLLGSAFITGELHEDAVRLLTPDDFYGPNTRRVFAAMLEMNGNTVISPITVMEQLKANGKNTDWISIGAMSQMMIGVLYHDSAVKEFVTTIKEHSISRRALLLSVSLQKQLLSRAEKPAKLLEEFEQQLLSLNSEAHADKKNGGDEGFHSLEEVTPQLKQILIDYHKGIASGVKTGMKPLDDMLDGGGLQPGAIYLLSAAEKTGKTSLMLGWAYDIAEIQKTSVVPYVTMEMTNVVMAKRLFSAHTGIPFRMFRPGFYDGPDKYFSKAMEALEYFSHIPIWIADNLFGFPQIARYLRRIVEEGHRTGKPVKVAFIDYLQLIGLGTSVQNRTDEVSKLSRAIKMLAMELGIAIVIVSSLNRIGLTEGQEPDTFNLRDSGTLAFDAEAVIFLHNPAYIPGKPYEYRPITEINLILSRQRNGPTGRIPLKLIGEYMQFVTEAQFRKSYGDTSIVNPVIKSQGQLHMEEKKVIDLWEVDDE